MPLSRPQWSALLSATARELGWGLRAVSREVRVWQERAAAIPDPALRHAALDALRHKRGHIDGAAMFWTLPPHRDPALLRTLVRYELLQDFLDGVTEPNGALGPQDGGQLYLALGDALDVERCVSDHYLHHRGCDDGGYLVALVEACRAGCRLLPSYASVRPLLLREAERADVLVINHHPCPITRDAALRAWANRHASVADELCWHELTAAVSGWITTHALLSLAGLPRVTHEDAEEMYAAYFPWLALALTLLDSYVDLDEDTSAGNHNYFVHFESQEAALERLRESIDRAATAVHALRHGERHAVLLGCMIALYLSKDSARTPELRVTTARIAAAGGRLPQLLLPVLRAWRTCNGQRRTT